MNRKFKMGDWVKFKSYFMFKYYIGGEIIGFKLGGYAIRYVKHSTICPFEIEELILSTEDEIKSEAIMRQL